MSIPARNPRRILFVDDDAQFLEVMKELMEASSAGEWEILTAPGASKAFAALQSQPVDMVVIDVQMPVMDGVQMLSLLNRSYPDLQKVVLTGFANEKYRTACLNSGAELFLEKPKTQDEWQSFQAMLNELLKPRPAPGFRGVMRRVELAEVVQLECTERNSSVLEIQSGGINGRIYIQEGAVVHAVAGAQKGQEALDCLLSLRGGEFKLAPFTEPPERTLAGSWESILLRASQAREKTLLPKPDKPKPGASPPPLPAASLAAQPSSHSMAGPGRLEVEEVLICSAQGDVLHDWQCHDLDMWVRFLEFISQRSQRLAQGMTLGEFSRLEIRTGTARILALVSTDRGVIVRTKSPPITGGKTNASAGVQSAGTVGTDAESKERAAEWLRRAPLARGVLVRGIRFADQTIVCDLDSRDFPRAALEQAFRSTGDTYQVLKAHQLPPTRLIWHYSRAALHCARQEDGTVLGAFVSARAEAADLAAVDRLLSDFLELNPMRG